jgi:hypothetical protein
MKSFFLSEFLKRKKKNQKKKYFFFGIWTSGLGHDFRLGTWNKIWDWNLWSGFD